MRKYDRLCEQLHGFDPESADDVIYAAWPGVSAVEDMLVPVRLRPSDSIDIREVLEWHDGRIEADAP